MQEDTIKNNLLYRYLLGTLNEDEQEQVEEEYFFLPERQQELWAIFDETAERYFQGALDAQDAQKFAMQLQTKPSLRARAENVQALYQFLSAPVPADKMAAKQVSERHLPVAKKRFALPALHWAGLAACLLLLGLGGYLLNRKANEPTREIAQIKPGIGVSPVPAMTPTVVTPTPQPSTVQSISPKLHNSPVILPRANVAAFYILQEDTRAGGEGTKLAITPQTQIIALHFEVQSPFQSHYTGVAKLNNGKIFKSFTNLKMQRQNNLAFVTLRLAVDEIPAVSFTVQINEASSNKEASPSFSQLFRLEK